MTNTEIDLPDPIPYYKFLSLNDGIEIKHKYAYVIKRYPAEGIMLIISRKEDIVTIRMADFNGNIINSEKAVEDKSVNQIMQYSVKIISTLKYIGISNAIFYFSKDGDIMRLVDIRVSLNKMASPGYIADFFAKQGIPTQEAIGKPIVIDDEGLKLLTDGVGDYKDKNYILKPTVPKSIIKDNIVIPLYVVIG